jgi:hypothetical protein
MAIRARESVIGARVFVLGVVLAIVVGAFSIDSLLPFFSGVLAILGLLVGFFVDEKDSKTFLLASVSLVIVSFAGIQGLVLSAAIKGIAIGKIISSVLSSLLELFVPATIVVALKTVNSLATN